MGILAFWGVVEPRGNKVKRGRRGGKRGAGFLERERTSDVRLVQGIKNPVV